MKRYINYLRYLLKHKWYVFLECCKIGLIWRGIIHDMSKFSLSEFIPYAKYFFNSDGTKKKKKKDKTGYYDPVGINENLDYAWLHHQRKNKHHWQCWILPKDGGDLKALKIPIKFVKEMLCDWKGASRAQGKDSGTVLEWYQANKNKIILHKDTRIVVRFSLKYNFISNYLDYNNIEYYKIKAL